MEEESNDKAQSKEDYKREREVCSMFHVAEKPGGDEARSLVVIEPEQSTTFTRAYVRRCRKCRRSQTPSQRSQPQNPKSSLLLISYLSI